MPEINPKFCLDTSCLIEAKNRYYAFDILPRFWDVILEGCNKKIIWIPMSVYEELENGYRDDELRKWSSENNEILFSPLDNQTFQLIPEIAQFVNDNFSRDKADYFLKSKDLEIIAFAKSKQLTLVTMETKVELENSRSRDGKYKAQVKIPNICEFCGVKYTNLFDMLRILKNQYNISL